MKGINFKGLPEEITIGEFIKNYENCSDALFLSAKKRSVLELSQKSISKEETSLFAESLLEELK